MAAARSQSKRDLPHRRPCSQTRRVEADEGRPCLEPGFARSFSRRHNGHVSGRGRDAPVAFLRQPATRAPPLQLADSWAPSNLRLKWLPGPQGIRMHPPAGHAPARMPMKSSERAYLIATLAFALLLIAAGIYAMATTYFPPGSHFDSERFSGLVVVFVFFPAVIILGPSIVGLLRKRLTTGGTILQCVVLLPAFMLVVPLALGIWGIVLLRRARKAPVAS